MQTSSHAGKSGGSRRAAALTPACRAVVIDQRGPRPSRTASTRRTDVVRGHRLDLDGAAVERDHRGRQHRRAGLQRDPFADGEALFEMHAASAREQVGELFLVGAERVDAEHAVLGQQRRALGCGG